MPNHVSPELYFGFKFRFTPMLSQKNAIFSKPCSHNTNKNLFITEESSIFTKNSSKIQNSPQNMSINSANNQSPKTKSFSQNYSMISQIGKGSFGKIYKVSPKNKISKFFWKLKSWYIFCEKSTLVKLKMNSNIKYFDRAILNNFNNAKSNKTFSLT